MSTTFRRTKQIDLESHGPLYLAAVFTLCWTLSLSAELEKRDINDAEEKWSKLSRVETTVSHDGEGVGRLSSSEDNDGKFMEGLWESKALFDI